MKNKTFTLFILTFTFSLYKQVMASEPLQKTLPGPIVQVINPVYIQAGGYKTLSGDGTANKLKLMGLPTDEQQSWYIKTIIKRSFVYN